MQEVVGHGCLIPPLISTDCQLTQSQWGPGNGSATHKTQGAKSTSTGRINLKTSFKQGCHQPTLIPCQPMYVRPAHFNLPKVDPLTKSTANQAL
jgi:hypothetical protein